MTLRWAPLSFLSPSHVLPLSHHLHGVAAATDLGSLWDSTSSRLLVPTSASLPGRLLVVPYVVPHRVLPTLQTSRAAQVGASPGLPHPTVLATPTELLQGERAQLWPACPLPTEMRLSGAKGSLHFQLETLTKGYPSVTPTCIPTVPPDRHIAQGGHSTAQEPPGFTVASVLIHTPHPGLHHCWASVCRVRDPATIQHPQNSTWPHSPRCIHTHMKVYNRCSCINKYSCTSQGGTEPDAVLR